MKGTNDMWELNCYNLTLTEVFLNQKRINVYEHLVKMGAFILFWLRKTFVSVKMYQLSSHVLFNPFIHSSLHF